MSQVNLKPPVQLPPPQVIAPAPAPGMSTAAKLVITVATLFFAVFIATAIARRNQSTTPPPPQPKDEAETVELKKRLERFKCGAVNMDAVLVPTFIELVNKKGDFSYEEKEKARALLGQLRKTPTQEQQSTSEIIAQQNIDFDASLHDDRKRAIADELGLLTQELSSTTDLIQKLHPFYEGMTRLNQQCLLYTKDELQKDSLILRIFRKKGYDKITDIAVRRCDVEIDKKWKVAEFNKKYNHEDFSTQREELETAYKIYHKDLLKYLAAYESWKIIFDESSKDAPNLAIIIGQVTQAP